MMLETLICRLRDGGAVFQQVDETVAEFQRRSVSKGVTDAA